MKFKAFAIPALAAVMAVAPFTATPAEARNNYWHGRGFSHGGPGPVLGLLGAAVVGAAVIASLPFQAVGAIAEPAYAEAPPPPQPYYAPQQQAYYPQQQPYYAPQPQVVYQQQPYYAQPVYYAPRPRVVYAGPGYYYR